jgi:hypothetical protein
MFSLPAGFSAAPRCHCAVVGYRFQASQTELKQGALFRIFSGIKLQQGVLRKKDNAVPSNPERTIKHFQINSAVYCFAAS